MEEIKREVEYMTDAQTQMMLEAIKIIIEKAESKEEALKNIERIQAKVKKNPQ